jgi:hypothetical protein
MSSFIKIRPVGAKLFHPHRQTGGQTYRQEDRQTGGQTDRQIDRRTDGQTGQTDRRTDGQTGGQTKRRTDRQKDRRTDGQTDRTKQHSLFAVWRTHLTVSQKQGDTGCHVTLYNVT